MLLGPIARKIALLSISLMVLFWGGGARAADCSILRNFSHNDQGVAPGFDPNLPAGATLLTVSYSPSAVPYASCQGGQTLNAAIGITYWLEPLPGTDHFYNLDNYVAVQLSENGRPLPLQRNWSIGPGGGTYRYTGNLKLTFKKLKNFNISQVSVCVGLGDSLHLPAMPNWCVGRTFQVITPTCTTSTAAVTLPLGAVNAASLPDVGAVGATSSAKSIRLTCQSKPKVSMRITGTAETGWARLFALAAQSNKAQGVAVELLRNNATVVPNTSYVISSAAGNTLDIALAARYVRTGAIVAGNAGAKMTATFTYN